MSSKMSIHQVDLSEDMRKIARALRAEEVTMAPA